MDRLAQTLRQVEKLIAWRHTGRKPASDSVEVSMVHEGLLHAYGEVGPDGLMLRTGQTSERGLYRLVTGAMKELAESGLPPNVDLTSVATTVDTWKESYFVKALLHFDTVEDLEGAIPYCWCCFKYDSLDKAHVISRGARIDIAEEADNIMLLCRSCHTLQHKHGWHNMFRLFPHIYPRYEYVINKYNGMETG